MAWKNQFTAFQIRRWRSLGALLILSFTVNGAGRPLAGAPAAAQMRQAEAATARLFDRITTEDSATRAEDIQCLRNLGQRGLDLALAAYQTKSAQIDDPAAARALQCLVDEVAGQYLGHRCGLFWHTDFNRALAVSRATDRPILSLRMLGRLTDQFSCANSRYFRTALYADPRIAKLLRTKFVLHWQSVRPVPLLTIDFGDGRVVRRTLTGNSAHYVVTPSADLLDCLPGMYGPQAFSQWLISMQELSNQVAACQNEPIPQRTSHVSRLIRQYHQESSGPAGGMESGPSVEPGSRNGLANVTTPADALTANEATFSKAAAETPLLRAAVADFRPPVTEPWTNRPQKRQQQARSAANGKVPAKTTGTGTPLRRTSKHAGAPDRSPEGNARGLLSIVNEPVRLSEATQAIIADEIEQRACRHRDHDLPWTPETTIAEFARTIEQDQRLNEKRLHVQVHQWFCEGELPNDIIELNRRVYADLFLMPQDDPWLGLIPDSVYTGLGPDDMSRHISGGDY